MEKQRRRRFVVNMGSGPCKEGCWCCEVISNTGMTSTSDSHTRYSKCYQSRERERERSEMIRASAREMREEEVRWWVVSTVLKSGPFLRTNFLSFRPQASWVSVDLSLSLWVSLSASIDGKEREKRVLQRQEQDPEGVVGKKVREGEKWVAR